MNIKRIIKEEIDDFDWIKDEPTIDVNRGGRVWVGGDVELLDKVLKKLYSLGIVWYQMDDVMNAEMGVEELHKFLGEDFGNIHGIFWRDSNTEKQGDMARHLTMYFHEDQKDLFNNNIGFKNIPKYTPQQILGL